MNKIACYIRVSTDKEEQQKSLKQQRILLEDQFSDCNIEMYSDTGSGTSFKRIGFQKLMHDAGLNLKILNDGRITFEVDPIREALFKEIVVINTSRFARNIAIIDILRVLWDYKKVNVRFLDTQRESKNLSDMILLQMFFAMAENEVAEISKRTKRGNKVSIMQNKIRNNSIFGYEFNRETNSLKIIEEEAKIVRFFYKTLLENGYKKTASLANEKGYRTRKGELWIAQRIKDLITNPKYKGFNVRNKYEYDGIFTDKKAKILKSNEWVVKKNDRIEPIVSEELWNEVQEAVKKRNHTKNRGENARIYDTRCKIKCPKCGANYVRCVNTCNAKKEITTHYLVCGNKKKYTKEFCNNENTTVGIVNEFIEKSRVEYSKNIELQIHFKILKLRNEMKTINETNDMFNLKDKEEYLKVLKSKLEKLIDTFMNSTSNTIQSMLKNKVDNLELEINKVENEIDDAKSKINNKNKYLRELNNKIIKLNIALDEARISPILTREEWLKKVDSIMVQSKENFEVIYKL